ncbi:LysR family transcriptional regulator [Shewanella submarina]|uniref:LysR family transcriptional regulator n=1 Tax=Shewanella submarina TaxID=2016376 RepID=A0ABV7GG23_9GAMM|nr:LysR family transcriptional regulator [Shewanella submarina]MCL1037877.1 LysR family transcriptional regulator [Shewanella submarina]
MENWDDYRVILALYRGKSLRQAGRELNMNHSTVCRRVAQLNRKYAAPVFEGSPQGYILTLFGQSLLESAEKIEAFAQKDLRLKRGTQIDISGSITLSIPPPIVQYLLLDDLLEFGQMYPQISLNVHTSYQLVDLDRSEADIVVRASNTPPEHLVGRRLFPITVAYYASTQYLETTTSQNFSWITANCATSKPDWLSETPWPDAGVALKIDDLVLRHHAAAAGKGLIRGACYIANAFPELVRVDNNRPFPFQELWILTHPDLRHVARIKLLMNFLTDKLREREALVTGLQLS